MTVIGALSSFRKRGEMSPHKRAFRHLDEKSAFRSCGRDLVEFFNSTGWAFYVQVVVPMRLPDVARLPGSHLLQAGLGPT